MATVGESGTLSFSSVSPGSVMGWGETGCNPFQVTNLE